MREIVILIPEIDAQQNVEIDVRINGRKRTLKYKVEIVEWEGCDPADDRVSVLRRKIANYDKNWQLMEIGAPTGKQIPLIFRQRKIEESTEY
ncbi:MAG: hypothetical protein K0B37_03055 [Bacteroidales bacterium]|jgi:hypothetical protein|nr:hypothetical protein [Bacteroidales bacterium]